jgi:hypothetical protein
MSNLLFSNGANVNQNNRIFEAAAANPNVPPIPRTDIPDAVDTPLTPEFVANMDLNNRAANDPNLQATTPSTTQSRPSI